MPTGEQIATGGQRLAEQTAAGHHAWTITPHQIRQLCPNASLDLDEICRDMTRLFATYAIDTKLRVCHFMAHAAVECAHFTTLVESSSGRQYENRKALGNTQKGDGPRFKGRGLLQLTGRWNYDYIGKKVGVSLVHNPDEAATVRLAVPIACEFWKFHHANTPSDHDDIHASCFAINGGVNGIADRKHYLALAKTIFLTPGTLETGSSPANAAAIATIG